MITYVENWKISITKKMHTFLSSRMLYRIDENFEKTHMCEYNTLEYHIVLNATRNYSQIMYVHSPPVFNTIS